MKYLGDYAASSTLYFTFSTHKADGTPITLAGTPSLAIYKADGTSQSTTGITLTVDFDSVTGLHSVKIECTDAFYAVGNDYSVVIAAGTVDSVSVVGYTIATFSIENRNTKADVVAISGDTTAADNAELMFDGTGYAGGTTKLQTAVASIATDAITAASVSADAVTKIQSGLSTHSAADVKTAIEAAGSSIASILADTAELQTDWVNGGRLDLLIDAIKAKTDTYVVPPTTSEIKTALEIAGGTLALILADTGELQTDLVNGGRLDLLIDAIKAKTDTIPANPAQVGSAMTLTPDYNNAKNAWSTLTAQQVWEHGTRSLSTFGTLVTDVAGAVWGVLTSAITTAGSIGKLITTNLNAMITSRLAAGSYTVPDNAGIGEIKAKTDQIAFTVPNRVDASATVQFDPGDVDQIASDVSTAVILTLGNKEIVVKSPLSAEGGATLYIVPGDTYAPTDPGRRIAWTIPAGLVQDLELATVLFYFHTGPLKDDIATAECVVEQNGTSEQVLSLALNATNTLAMVEGAYKVVASWPSEDVTTIAIGTIVLDGFR